MKFNYFICYMSVLVSEKVSYFTITLCDTGWCLMVAGALKCLSKEVSVYGGSLVFLAREHQH